MCQNFPPINLYGHVYFFLGHCIILYILFNSVNVFTIFANMLENCKEKESPGVSRSLPGGVCSVMDDTTFTDGKHL